MGQCVGFLRHGRIPEHPAEVGNSAQFGLNSINGATNGADLSSPSDPVSAGARLVGYNYAT
ncbi:MAG: hypothetical protein R3C17_04345 [Planctomycetaceae bacterium]